MRVNDLYARLASIDAAAETRYLRIVLGTLLALFMLGGYYVIGEWNATRFATGEATPIDLAIPYIDDRIPTIPLWVWPYFLYIPFLVSSGFLQTSFRDFLFFCTNYGLASAVGFAFFVLFPARMEYSAVECAGVSCEALRQLHAMDGGLNIFPSLHVSHCLLAMANFWYARSRFLPVAALVAGAIIIATLFTGQHYVIDLPAGMVNAILAWSVARYVFMRVSTERPENVAS